jgi:hypothetical protein
LIATTLDIGFANRMSSESEAATCFAAQHPWLRLSPELTVALRQNQGKSTAESLRKAIPFLYIATLVAVAGVGGSLLWTNNPSVHLPVLVGCLLLAVGVAIGGLLYAVARATPALMFLTTRLEDAHQKAVNRVVANVDGAMPFALYLRAFRTERFYRVPYRQRVSALAAHLLHRSGSLRESDYPSMMISRLDRGAAMPCRRDFPIVMLNNASRFAAWMDGSPALVVFDRDWKDAVVTLARRATAIVLLLDEFSSGLNWELQFLAAESLQYKTIVLIPSAAPMNRDSANQLGFHAENTFEYSARYGFDIQVEELRTRLLALAAHATANGQSRQASRRP